MRMKSSTFCAIFTFFTGNNHIRPKYTESGIFPVCSYATALLALIAAEYAEASGGWETAAELWPVVLHQAEITAAELDRNGMFRDSGKYRLFIDWCDQLVSFPGPPRPIWRWPRSFRLPMPPAP